KRTPIPESDIPDILEKWPTRAASRKSFVVSIKEIEKNDWSLAPERYRPFSSDQNSSFGGVVGKRRKISFQELFASSGSDRIGPGDNAPVMSITMDRGLIDQSAKFKKRIASADISHYKKVYRNELVVGFPIDEGVLGFQKKYQYAAVSPAYTI